MDVCWKRGRINQNGSRKHKDVQANYKDVPTSDGKPFNVNIVKRSCSWPWISPTMVNLWSSEIVISCRVGSPANILRVWASRSKAYCYVVIWGYGWAKMMYASQPGSEWLSKRSQLRRRKSFLVGRCAPWCVRPNHVWNAPASAWHYLHWWGTEDEALDN